MSCDELLGSLHVSIGNCSNDFGDSVRRNIDPDDRASFRDVDMGRRMIEGIDPHLESTLANDRRHDDT
jgi:hypothetical protein